MSKIKTTFICQSCGNISGKWLGRCPECNEWNSFVEEVVEKPSAMDKGLKNYKPSSDIINIQDIKGVESDRFKTGLNELDQVLGGGVVKGSVLLIGGEPGIGKSTIILQVAGILANLNSKVLYLTGEESPTQIKMRADRLNVHSANLSLLATTAFEDLLLAIEVNKFDYIIVDSVQTVASAELVSTAGTVGQIRHITYRLVEIAKSRGITVFIIGQITKDGAIAGPKMLEHLVDTVLYFEGDYTRGVRILRSVKNRFGSTDEVGVFEMTSNGLIEADDKAFIDQSENKSITGRALSPVMEGSRPFLVEVQALVAPTFFQFPKRNATGFDTNRLTMLIAILEKKVGVNLSTCDVYLNIAGGLKVNEPAVDLAVIASIVSSFKDIALPFDTIFTGEVGLTGHLRHIPNMAVRINEGVKFKIKNLLAPIKNEHDDRITLIDIKEVKQLIDFIGKL